MHWTNIRYKLVKRLLSDDERYLIVRALDSRKDELEKRKVLDKTVDSFEIENDIDDYRKLRDTFSVDGSWM